MASDKAPQDCKLVKFELTFEDGTVRWLEGDDANIHYEWLNNICVLASVRSSTPPHPDVKWYEQMVLDFQ